jgi:hypothetical protein
LAKGHVQNNASSVEFARCTSLKTRWLENPNSPDFANLFSTNYMPNCQEKTHPFFQYLPPPPPTLLAKRLDSMYNSFHAKKREKAKLMEQKAAFAHLISRAEKRVLGKEPANNGK